MSHGYRLAPLGVQPDPGHISVWETELKSWIDSPNPESGPVAAGTVQIRGVAFGGGGRPLTRVEVSVDAARRCAEAKLTGPDLGPFAWRQFALPMQLGAATHTVVCRADRRAGQRAAPALHLQRARLQQHPLGRPCGAGGGEAVR